MCGFEERFEFSADSPLLSSLILYDVHGSKELTPRYASDPSSKEAKKGFVIEMLELPPFHVGGDAQAQPSRGALKPVGKLHDPVDTTARICLSASLIADH
jgi:hypothetical protein